MADTTTAPGATGGGGAGGRQLRARGAYVPLTQRRRPAPRVVLAVAGLGAALAFLDSTMLPVALPAIQRSFPDSDFGDLSWVLNGYNIAFAAFLLAGVRLAGMFGRRRMFKQGAMLFTVAAVLCAGADTLGELVALRVLQGFAAAVLVSASLVLVIERFGQDRRARGVALWGVVAALAAGLGAPVGGAVAAAGWRWVFVVNVPLGVAAVVLARRGLVDGRGPVPRPAAGLRGAALLATALGCVTLSLVKGPDWGWTDRATLGSLLAAAVAMLGYLLNSRRRATPLVEPGLWRERSFLAGNALMLIAGAGFGAYLLTHVLYLHGVWGYPVWRAGLAITPAAVIAVAVAVLLGGIGQRRGHRFIVIAGALVWAGGLLWYLARVGPQPDFLAAWLPGQVLEGIGVGATLPMLGGAALAGLATRDGYATAAAALGGARQLGTVIGIAVLVLVVGAPAGAAADEALRRGWVVAAACCALVAIGGGALGGARRASAVVTDAPPPPPRPLVDPTGPLRIPRRIAAVEKTQPITIGEVDPLRALPLFAGLDPATLAELRDHAEQVDLAAGSYLFHAGQPSDSVYVVRNGHLQVVQNEVVLRDLGRGEVVGELGFLIDEPRSASIRAVRDSTLIRLTKTDFDRIADTAVLSALVKVLATRLHQNPPPAAPLAPTLEVVIAVVGVDAYAPVPMVTAELVKALSNRLRVLDPGRITPDKLERVERVADKVFLQATVADADWCDFCLRSADRVVLVSADPAPPRVALPVRAMGADLVLAGPPADGAHRRAWEKVMTPRSVHQVHPGNAANDVRGLARRIAGRSVGLVLSGGAARAYAHLGVIDELEAAGVRVDRYAGTSMGAVIAAVAATGIDAAAVDAHVYEYFVRSNPTSDYTLPRKSLIRGHRTMSGLYHAFHGLHVEELPKEFRCVSVDLLARRAVVHRSGLVADVVGCSLRVPGLFAPAVFDGSLHVDGGVLDNLPVGALARHEGPLIAVSVSPDQPEHPVAAAASTPAPQVPNVVDTIIRTMTIGNAMASSAALARADLAIHPDTTSIGFLEWHQIDRAREIGRVAAREAMPQIIDLVRG